MPRAPKRCGHPGCDTRTVGRTYCPTHTALHQRRANTTDRGYGAHHKRARAAWAPRVAAGGVNCWRCAQPINPNGPWHLGHDDTDRTRYRGPEHVQCNTRAGALKRAGLPPDGQLF